MKRERKENRLLKKEHIKYLIKYIRLDISIMRRFRKKFPVLKKTCPDPMKEYKLQMEILKVLQVMKKEIDNG